VATRVAKITGHAGREPAKVDSRMTVPRSDILVENHGSSALLHPGTAAGREWLKANCGRSGYQPLTGGTLLCNLRYAAVIVAGAVESGLEVGMMPRRLVSTRVLQSGEGVQQIEATCAQCGIVATTEKWSDAVTAGAVHEHQPVRVLGVMSRTEWSRMPRAHRSTRPRQAYGVYAEDYALHLDLDGLTILIPVEVRTSWAEFMKMCHERPLPPQALDELLLLEVERMWNRS
jgi:hypothetical protein